MRRSSRIEEPDNDERWVISYADFITLLFAFFVVMYSVSSVNEGKYKVLSQSLNDVFAADANDMPNPVTNDTTLGETLGSKDSAIQFPHDGNPLSQDGEGVEGQGDADADKDQQNAQAAQATQQIGEIAKQLSDKLSDLISDGSITLKGNELWVEVDIQSNLLFSSGDADPNGQAKNIIKKIGRILEDVPNPIHVEGFTDNVPIETRIFPSNWELSSARAAAIVRLLAQSGVQPERLAAVGYGEFQPVVDNTTEAGRSRNRRVVLIISRDMLVRRGLSAVGSQGANEVKDALATLHDKTKQQADVAIFKINPAKEAESLKPKPLEGGGLLFTAP